MTPHPSPLLSLKSVSRAIGARHIVSNVSFDMAPGEVVAILGPSGSGKTSLLRMIAGFDAPSSGTLHLHGREVSSAGHVLVAPEHRALALAFQDATLYPHLCAVGNAAFAIRSGDKRARLASARTALQDMGLNAMDGRDVATLSGGEAQRVSLARALAANAKLLLLDEPFGNVDRLTRQDLLLRLKARLSQGAHGVHGLPSTALRPPGLAAVIITHDPADVVELGARALVMRQGELVADGSFDAIASGQCGPWAQAFLKAGQA